MTKDHPHRYGLRRMESGNESAKRIFGLAFVGALAFYLLSYFVIEHWRPRKGPWEVTFARKGGRAAVTINQHRLGITNVQVSFGQHPNDTAPSFSASDPPSPVPESMTPLNETIVFSQARKVPFELPFGRCVFLDTTVLPGTVTMQLFGHEIELLPRVLVIDHREHPWQSGRTVQLGEK